MSHTLTIALAISLLLPLAACGDKDDTGGSSASACERYVDVHGACLESFGDSLSDHGIPDDFCDSYPEGSGLDASFACYADILESADCSTEEGYQASWSQAESDC